MGDWDFLISDYQDDYECVLLMFPGHDNCINSCPSFEQFSEGISQLAQEKPSHLIAYSMGARLGLNAVLKNPSLWQSIILESLNPGLSPQESKTRYSEDLKRAQEICQNYTQFLDTWYQAPLWGTIQSHLQFQARLAQQKTYDAPLIAQVLTQFSISQQQRLWDPLIKLPKPIHLIAGSEDSKYCQIAQKLQTQSPHIQTHIIPNAAHNTHFMAPETVRTIIHSVIPRR